MIRKLTAGHPYICLTGMVILTGIILYAPFIFGNYIFAWADWGYDTKHANLPMYEYLIQRVSDGRTGQYDFTFGLGTSSFVAAGSFFDLFLSVILLAGHIFGKQAAGYGLIFVHLLKNIALGCMGLHYLRLFGYTNPVCITASYVLSFCGYIMVTGQHYEYATYAVYGFFLFLMCEKTVRSKKWRSGLAVSVFLLGLLGPYASFWTLVSGGVYCIIRVLQTSRDRNMRAMIQKTSVMAFYMLLGLLLSMFAFLPQCYEIFCVSARIQQERTVFDLLKEAFRLVPAEYLKSGFFRLYSNHLQGLINSWEGPKAYFSATPYFFSLFFPFCIAHEIYKLVAGGKNRQQVWRLLVVLLSAFCFFFAFFPLISCGAAYIEYRFAFVFLPLFVFCFADTMEDLFYRRDFSCAVCILAGVSGSVFLYLLFDSENTYSITSLYETIGVSCLMLCLIVMICKKKKAGIRRLLKITLCILIAASQWFDTGMELYTERSILLKEDYDARYHMSYMEQFTKEIRDLEGSRFLRLDRTFVGYDGSPDILYSLVCPARTASIYSNTLSRHTLEFVDKIMKREPMTGQNQVGYALHSYGVWFDPHTADLLGLKYIVSQQNTPFAGWKIISSHDGYYLYQKEDFTSAGLVYDSYITTEAFEKLDVCSQAAVTQHAVILDKKPKTKTLHPLQQEEQAYVEISAEQKDGCAEADIQTENNGILRMHYEGSGSYELLNAQREVIDQGSLEADHRSEKVLTVTKDVRHLTVKPEADSRIGIDQIQIQLREFVPDYEHAGRFYNDKWGSTVEGDLCVDGEKLLYLPITYDAGWKVWINGKKVDTYCADYGFTAVVVPDGKNHIVFRYSNSFFYFGTALGIAGVILAAVLYVLYRKKIIAKEWWESYGNTV